MLRITIIRKFVATVIAHELLNRWLRFFDWVIFRGIYPYFSYFFLILILILNKNFFLILTLPLIAFLLEAILKGCSFFMEWCSSNSIFVCSRFSSLSLRKTSVSILQFLSRTRKVYWTHFHLIHLKIQILWLQPLWNGTSFGLIFSMNWFFL